MPTPPSSREPTQPRKLDPRLAAATQLSQDALKDLLTIESGAPFLLRDAGQEPGSARAKPLHGVRLAAGGEVIASVLVWFRGSAARFEALGIHVRSVIGDVATADLPLGAAAALEQDPDVIFVELDQPLFPLLGATIPAMRVDRLWAEQPSSRGEGTVIGVVDLDGLDLHHPDFCSAGEEPARTRIRYLWDQTAQRSALAARGSVPETPDYGVEYTSADIDRDRDSRKPPYRVVRARPSGPHGTHVSGIAAGSGRASGGERTGVAPGADIIFVNLSRERDSGVGLSGRLVDALAYIFARAGRKPCVVNLSLGTRLGPRDGTSVLERAIDNFVATPGRAVVVAAGNDGDTGRYKDGPISADGELELDLIVPHSTSGDTFEIWYSKDERLDLTVVDPSGARSAPVAAGESRQLTAGGVTFTVQSVVESRVNGDNCIMVLVHEPLSGSGPSAATTWSLRLQRSAGRAGAPPGGHYHACAAGTSSTRWKQPSRERCSLTSPATAEGAVTVANYMDNAGGLVSSTSSRGPTRDGRRKPDLAAPGTGVWSTKSAARPTDRGDWYAPSTGTSMAAPHVAGLIALIFERLGPVPVQAIKAMLVEHADRAGLPPGWDPAYGWGRARAPVEDPCP